MIASNQGTDQESGGWEADGSDGWLDSTRVSASTSC
jgi:hypothetical protein